ENGYISLLKGTWKIRVIHVKDIPLTFEGKAVHNIANTLPSVMATYLFKAITIEDIRSGLQTFIAGSATTPGRLNFFHFKNFTFLADFAHNPHGLQLLCEFVEKLDYPYKVGVISGTGDRRDEDIKALGSISAKYFDEIIIRCDKNLRGRTAEEIISLLQEGINEVNPKVPQTVIANENLALEYVYTNHKPGALYTIMCDVVAGALDKIKELKDRENSE
ncbi:MAG: glutamate ligase domain-containing protein, partial [Sediminibacterium sp.]